jgi:tRNA G46 methylase TrmB
MVHQAARNPDKGLIGCEPYINGVAMLLGKIRTSGVENLRVHPGDVRDLFDVCPTPRWPRRSSSIPIRGRRNATTAAAS